MSRNLLRCAVVGAAAVVAGLLAPVTAQANTDGNSTLVAGESMELSPVDGEDDGQIYSDNSEYGLFLQSDGNLVERFATGRTALWHARTYGNPGSTATMQSDGNFVVRSAEGVPLFHTRTYGNPGAFVKLQNDGNLVVYSATGRALWASMTRVDTMRAGDVIADIDPGQFLLATDRKTRAIIDGRQLVVRGANGQELWRSPAAGDPQSLDSLFMQSDGNLAIYEGQGKQKPVAIWSSRTYGNPGAFVRMQIDGNLVIYAADGRALWASKAGRLY